MFKYIQAAVAAGILLSTTATFAQTVPTCTIPKGTLTAAQCTQLRSDLDKYIAYVNAWLLAQPVKKQAYLKPLVDAAIAEAKRLVNKACPAPVVQTFECTILDSTQTALVSIGVKNLDGALTNNSQDSQKVACISSNACLSAGVKFLVNGPIASTRCSTNDPSAIQLTDAEFAAKLNAVP